MLKEGGVADILLGGKGGRTDICGEPCYREKRRKRGAGDGAVASMGGETELLPAGRKKECRSRNGEKEGEGTG